MAATLQEWAVNSVCAAKFSALPMWDLSTSLHIWHKQDPCKNLASHNAMSASHRQYSILLLLLGTKDVLLFSGPLFVDKGGSPEICMDDLFCKEY